jgi:hypothetical protein
MNNNIRDDEKYYHEQVTYDSKREQWPGVFSLLLIPLFLLVVGAGFFSLFRLPNDGSGEVNGLQIGIGGGTDVTVTPTARPSTPPSSPVKGEDMGENFFIIQ